MQFLRIASIALSCSVALLFACGSDDEANGTPGTSTPTGSTETDPPGSSGNNPGSSGGEGGGPTGGCGGSAAEPAAASTIAGYMDTLPYGKPADPLKSEIIDVIIKTCNAFGPPPASNPGWEQKHCWAQLVGSILKESSYNQKSTIVDDYGKRKIGGQTANDPTVGFTQIRFSSTVHDFAQSGNVDALSCIGCTLPAEAFTNKALAGDSPYWAVSGPQQNLTMMQSVSCNIGLGAWYYYLNATGNGNTKGVTYAAGYCESKGVAANLVTGLVSHLLGPESAFGVVPDMNGVNKLDDYAVEYITEIKGWFDTMVGATSGTHPFFVKLNPNPTQYCPK